MADTKQKPQAVIEVVELATGKVVHTVPILGATDPEKVMMGMMINMDLDRYSVRERGKP